MSDLRTDDLREIADRSMGDAQEMCWAQSTEAGRVEAMVRINTVVQPFCKLIHEAADEIDRLRELVDVLKTVPGGSIVLSKDEYDALTAAIESPPEPTPALRRLMGE